MRADERNDLILSGVTVGFALLVMFVVIPMGVEDPGQINVLALGPSFWPFIIALFICLMGLIVGMQAYRRFRAGEVPRMAAGGGQQFALARWIGALVLLAGYYALLGVLGMVVSSILTLLLFMLLGGERRPVLIASISLVLPIALYLFFRYVANVAIPMGVFGDWVS